MCGQGNHPTSGCVWGAFEAMLFISTCDSKVLIALHADN